MELLIQQTFTHVLNLLSTAEFLARLQFAATVIIHYIFPPLTIGLSIFVAICETAWAITGKEHYRRMTKFWGRLFLINFALGVVTGIVMEFQFGMNWSEFSRYVGNVFGVPLAIEILVAFFLESTFIGLWIFGWDKFSRKVHALIMWIVALGSSMSALWIIVANAWMQEPVGYIIKNGKAELNNFGALLTTGQFQYEFWHTWAAALVTAGFFALGISAFHLVWKKKDLQVFKTSFRLAAIFSFVSILAVVLLGHFLADHVAEKQPMKLAAMEAMWTSENPASEGVIVIPDEFAQKNLFQIRIPYGLDLIMYGSFSGEVQGMKELQAKYEAKYGPGDYIPPVFITFYAFRAMVGAGFLMLLIAIYLLFKTVIRKSFKFKKWFLWFLVPCIALPYIANITGWIVTEVGRQPWIVHGLLKTNDAVSPGVSYADVVISLAFFIIVYGLLLLVDVYLLWKFAVAGTKDFESENLIDTEE
jgi:cytochrome bd ubiquinol oxidase subunit I